MFCPHTLVQSFVVEGIGLHTGATVRTEVRPTDARRGRVFVRAGVEIPACPSTVVDTRRCVMLGVDDVTIATVEHLLAALALAGVDNAEIHVDGPELPVLDGAAQAWAAAIATAGVCAQAGEAPVVRIAAPGWLTVGQSEFFLTPAPDLALYAALTIPDTPVQAMMAGGRVADPAVQIQMSRARTYGLEAEVQALWDAGLARGGSLENAVVITREGYLNPDVHPQEPAWHKVLDLCGDLALLGARLQGQVVAVRAGHASHVALVRHLLTQESASASGGVSACAV